MHTNHIVLHQGSGFKLCLCHVIT